MALKTRKAADLAQQVDWMRLRGTVRQIKVKEAPGKDGGEYFAFTVMTLDQDYSFNFKGDAVKDPTVVAMRQSFLDGDRPVFDALVDLKLWDMDKRHGLSGSVIAWVV